MVRLPRVWVFETKLLNGRGEGGAKKHSAHAPHSPQMFLHLRFEYGRHLSFQSTDKPLLNHTKQQVNFCDPFQILASPTPPHHTHALTLQMLRGPFFRGCRVSRLFSDIRNLTLFSF